ncbi:MAG: hypothetical protein Q8P67_10005 [archaeon]|nr:hypothetical protein [archaeon]
MLSFIREDHYYDFTQRDGGEGKVEGMERGGQAIESEQDADNARVLKMQQRHAAAFSAYRQHSRDQLVKNPSKEQLVKSPLPSSKPPSGGSSNLAPAFFNSFSTSLSYSDSLTASSQPPRDRWSSPQAETCIGSLSSSTSSNNPSSSCYFRYLRSMWRSPSSLHSIDPLRPRTGGPSYGRPSIERPSIERPSEDRERSYLESESKKHQEEGLVMTSRVYSFGLYDLSNMLLYEFPFWQLQQIARMEAPVVSLDLASNHIERVSEHRLFMLAKSLGLDRTLTCLVLGNNRLQELPRTLACCKQLQVLDLSHNALTAIPEVVLSGCSMLQELDLSFNRLRRLPLAIAELPHLRALCAASNPPLEFPPPSVVSAGFSAMLEHIRAASKDSCLLPAVSGLDFRGEGLMEAPWEGAAQLLEMGGNAKELHLAQNRIASLDCQQMLHHIPAAGVTLRLIDLSHNHLTHFPSGLCLLASLESLSLAHNQLCDVPSSLGALASLHSLDVSFNCLTSLPPELSQLDLLHHFDASHNPRLRFPPPEILEQGARAVLRSLAAAADAQVLVSRGNHIARLTPSRPELLSGARGSSVEGLMRRACVLFCSHQPAHAFALVFGHPQSRALLLEFLVQERSDELLRFLSDVDLLPRIRTQQSEPRSLLNHVAWIFSQYFSADSPDCLSLAPSSLLHVQDRLSEAIDGILPPSEVFSLAALEVTRLLESDPFHRFMRNYIASNDIIEAK